MEIRQTQKLSQALALTPQMKQSLLILQLPLLELRNHLESQLEDNPVLEYEEAAGEMHNESLDRLIEAKETSSLPSPGESREDIRRKHDYKETLITKPPTLAEYLLRNLRILSLPGRKYEIAEFIIGSLDENGYLNMSPEETAGNLNKKSRPEGKITKKEVEEIIRLIHTLGPAGVGARNLKDCLLIQLRLKNRQKSLAYKIVESCLKELAKNKIKLIARKLKVAAEEVNKAKGEIAALEPKPGRIFTESSAQQIGSWVDIFVENVEGRYKVSVNSKGIPRLRISSHYLSLFKSKKTTAETKKYIRERLKAASDLIKAIAQRETTVKKIAELIVAIQADFFEHRDTSLLKPLTLKDVAKIVGRNESTVSRVVNNKYMETPYGVYRLNYFFTKALKTDAGKSISGEYIKCKILNLIEEEDPKTPLKDSRIVKLLKEEGIAVARRTVAKYRGELKLPPYHQRKKHT